MRHNLFIYNAAERKYIHSYCGTEVHKALSLGSLKTHKTFTVIFYETLLWEPGGPNESVGGSFWGDRLISCPFMGKMPKTNFFNEHESSNSMNPFHGH